MVKQSKKDKTHIAAAEIKATFADKEFFIQLFGRNAYAVGGYVRELIRGVPTDKDIDILITRHSVEDIVEKLKPFGRVDVVGKSFGVIKFITKGRAYDIALPRRDAPQQAQVRGHKDFIISSDPGLPVEADLERRDFRCNSIALRLVDDRIVDPFQGRRDIQQKIIRMTNPRTFADDPLRVLRAARFASVLNFSIDPELYEISKNIDLSGLSVERVNEELFKILLSPPLPSKGLEELFRLGALRQLFPELYRLSLAIQDSIFHPEKDSYGHHTVWHHTKITVDQAKRLARIFRLGPEKELTLLLAALYHDAGKASTAEWEYKRGRMVITNSGHDLASEKITKAVFDKYRIFSSNAFNVRKMVLALIRCHHRASELWQNRESVTKKAFNRLAADAQGEIDLLICLDAADRAGRKEKPIQRLDREGRWLREKFQELNVSKETIKPLILGRDLIALGMPSGPAMGQILKKLYQLQLDNAFETREQGLKLAEELLRKASSPKP